MSGTSSLCPLVVPAQLSFLAIYNPSLASTDESIQDQIVFYSSKSTRSRRARTVQDDGTTDNAIEDENEKLLQVGLAQGMVDFANNFSNGKSIDTIDTEKSRIVLHELEDGWWILASIDLTRLPTTRSQQIAPSEPLIDYSSREVAPPQLLIEQLIRAHSIFLLLHAATLADLYSRLDRPAFCNLLGRFWTRFIWNWDVLLHGNPTAEIYNGIKLSAGGELGIGVGEEEWGSGEREVLEDFVSRTDGLVDLVVSRFGDALVEPGKDNAGNGKKALRPKQEPWLGTDAEPRPSDGVLFSGVGTVSRRSLATVSQWMEEIYRYGEDAYGVGENPTSRHRRKRRKLSPRTANEKTFSSSQLRRNVPKFDRKLQRTDITPPGIPPPLVKVVERSPDQATTKVEPDQSTTNASKEDWSTEAGEERSIFATDKMMKYLTLGYGSSWTLDPRGFGNTKEPTSPLPPRVDDLRLKDKKNVQGLSSGADEQESEQPTLQEVDPTPEISDDGDPPFIQRLEQSIGKYLIGLTGDLENAEFEDHGDEPEKAGSEPASQQRKPERIILRTITVDMGKPSPAPPPRPSSSESMTRGETSDAKSTEGPQAQMTRHQKLQIVVYVHQPFIIVFLFQLHTPSLTLPAFYRSIHHQLGPLQRPLLRSTDSETVARRIADAMGECNRTTSPPSSNAPVEGQTIHHVVYDPAKMTVHSSLPNIPSPATLAAEGLERPSGTITVSGSWYTLGIPVSGAHSRDTSEVSSLVKSDWTRVEALNVHTQILHTWAATRQGREIERTVKTSRAWWVLWMRIPSQSQSLPSTYDVGGDEKGDKEAFLVRKATDSASAKSRQENRASSGSAGRWLLREQTRDVSGSIVTSSGGGARAAGVSEGVGVDARSWVEGLLSLNG